MTSAKAQEGRSMMTTLDEFFTQAVEEKHCLFHLRTQLDISQFPLQLGLAM